VVWCLVFAALHVFWAVGGQTGLASSAGAELAARRPVSFVVFGLWGVAAILAAGALLAAWAAWGHPRTRWLRGLRILAVVVAAGLLLRGVLVEAALTANLGGVRQQVGPLETHWSLVLWNPWFIIGGICFGALALAIHQRLAVAATPVPAAGLPCAVGRCAEFAAAATPGRGPAAGPHRGPGGNRGRAGRTVQRVRRPARLTG
jgi:hypothetical protein